MRSVEEHLAACLATVAPLPAREVALLDALGCLLAEDVVSGIDMPRFDNSSMDGYAVRSAEVIGASEESPRTLPVQGDIQAGSPGVDSLEPGATWRIMTGAPLPHEADAVVPVEWTDGGVTSVRITRAPVRGQYIRPIGDDMSAGDVVLRAGGRLTSRQIALLAAVGRDAVRVHPRPRVVVLPSGNELVAAGKPLGPGQIYDSNGPALIAAVRELGADAEHGGVIDDEPAAVTSLLTAASVHADLIVTTGGVSAGAYDTVKAVLRDNGVWFGKVAMQPGSPQGIGVFNGTPIVTLPGNPVSALVSFDTFVRPVIARLAGAAASPRLLIRAVAAVGWRSPPGKRQFVRVTTSRGSDGSLLVTPVGGQGSHLVADLAHATALAVVPEAVTFVDQDDRVEIFWLGEPQ